MTRYVPPVRRRERGKGHVYEDGNGQRIPGVTTILGDGLPKPALINWAAAATAEAAINRWDELAAMPPAERLKTLERARYETTDKAKKRGTEVHAYAERLVAGEKVTGIPTELRGHIEAYVRFLDRFDVEPVLVEAVVVNYTHGYAGTLDLIAHIGETTWLLDVKTGEKGIWPETALQLAAYRFAEFYVGPDGEEHPMIPVDACGAIHTTSDDAVLIPTASELPQFNLFRIAAKVRDFTNNGRDLIGPPVEPDTHPSTAKVIWEET